MIVSPGVSPQSEPKEKKTGVCGSMYSATVSFLAGKINNSHDFQGLCGRHYQISWLTCTARRWRGCAPRSAPRFAITHARQQVSVSEGKRQVRGKIHLVSTIPRGFYSRAPPQACLEHVRRRCNDGGAWRARLLAIQPRENEIHESLSARGDTLTRIIQPSWGFRRQTAAG